MNMNIKVYKIKGKWKWKVLLTASPRIVGPFPSPQNGRQLFRREWQTGGWILSIYSPLRPVPPRGSSACCNSPRSSYSSRTFATLSLVLCRPSVQGVRWRSRCLERYCGASRRKLFRALCSVAPFGIGSARNHTKLGKIHVRPPCFSNLHVTTHARRTSETFNFSTENITLPRSLWIFISLQINNWNIDKKQ